MPSKKDCLISWIFTESILPHFMHFLRIDASCMHLTIKVKKLSTSDAKEYNHFLFSHCSCSYFQHVPNFTIQPP